MTGYGRGSTAAAGADRQVTGADRQVTVELRAVNHRGLDVKLRGRDLEPEAEVELQRALRVRLARGSVLVNVDEEGGASSFDADRVRSLHASLESLRQELGLPTPVDLATVAAFAGALGDRIGSGARRHALAWDAVRPALEHALNGLVETRRAEGARLAADLQARTATLRQLATRIQATAAAQPERAARRLEQRLTTLLRPGLALDPARLAQEAAILAERLDVTEETVRLDAHLAAMGDLLAGSEDAAIGRKLDFLCQEVGRELSTVGAKSQDVEIAQLVVEGKAELEKIREQAQNIE